MTLSRKIAKEIIEKDISANDLVLVLQSYNLVSLLPSILDQVKRIISGKKKESGVIIESPFPLSEDSISHIKKIICDEHTSHEVIIEKKLLAGFKARYKGMLYDGSAERIVRQFIQ